MKKSRYVVLAALFAGTLSLTACGSSSDSQMNTGTSQSSGAVQTTGETREGVIDGVMASKFLKRVAELLENPYMLLV